MQKLPRLSYPPSDVARMYLDRFAFYFSTADAKLNNFTRLEPTMALLDIKFDTIMVITSFFLLAISFATNYYTF